MPKPRTFNRVVAQPGGKGDYLPAPDTVNRKVSRPTRDWAVYNRGLVARGGAWTFLLNMAQLDSWRTHTGKPGQPAYSVEAINAMFMVKNMFRLTLRGAEGFMRSVFSVSNLDPDLVPTFSTLCRRRDQVTFRTPHGLAPGGAIVIDGTGVGFRTTGSWYRTKYGTKKRDYVRVTVTTDAASGIITGVVVTPEKGKGTGEASVALGLLAAQPHTPTACFGDGAYDTKRMYLACARHDMALVVPPKEGAVYGLAKQRDYTISRVKRLGMVEWKKRSGYHSRSLAETTFSVFKTLYGDETYAHTFTGAQADVCARFNLYNRIREQELAG